MKSRTGDVRDMRRETQWLTGDGRSVHGERGFTVAHGDVYRGWQGITWYRGSVQGLTGGAQVDDRENFGDDRERGGIFHTDRGF